MKAVNLYTLTRITDAEIFSMLEQALSGRAWRKNISTHEAASARALTEKLAGCFDTDISADNMDWIRFFEGFYFSYTIEHISKEFDLLKLSAEPGHVLNIELKSEAIEEERIRRQLEQNRYYLAHIAKTIYSYTYVMETDTLYCLNDHGYLRKCEMEELADIMRRPALQDFAEDGIEEYFRAQEYLISPVSDPEKFLQGRYFLTNQQAEFRRQIMEQLQEFQQTPVIAITGSAGTGKTLLLLDIALGLSRRQKVLFLHGGPLRDGHRILDARLHKVDFRSGLEYAAAPDRPSDSRESHLQESHLQESHLQESTLPERHISESHLQAYTCICMDEANRFPSSVIRDLVKAAIRTGIPCLLSYDPHTILGSVPAMEDTEAILRQYETLRLEFSGNIRINRPIFSFMRAIFHQKDQSVHADYSCIDVLYAADQEEASRLTDHYLSKGFKQINLSGNPIGSGEYISQEYEKVILILDRRFYYDDSLHLCADQQNRNMLPILYEGLSRTRERLCLVITGNRPLYKQLLAIRTGQP